MARPRGLGRGLSALIPEQPQVPAAGTQAGTLEIGLDVIDPNPFQPREVFARDALEELAQSIRLHGLVQPVVVRETTGGRYQLVVGERRLRAARLALGEDGRVLHAPELVGRCGGAGLGQRTHGVPGGQIVLAAQPMPGQHRVI